MRQAVRRSALTLLIIAAVAIPLVPAHAADGPCGEEQKLDCGAKGESTDQGFGATVTINGAPAAAPAGNRPRRATQPLAPTYVDRNLAPTCTGNGYFDAGVLCTAAVETCPVPGETRFWVFEATIVRATGKPVPGTAPRLVDTVCLSPDEPALDPAVAIPALVQTQFGSVVVRGGGADVSPRPETLVNIATRFQTDAPADYVIPLTLLNQSVVITARAESYTWHLDNGETRVSTEPKGYLEYTYRRSGTYNVFVSITWSGSFSVNGGPSQPISGTVEIDGEPTEVRVQQARSELVRN